MEGNTHLDRRTFGERRYGKFSVSLKCVREQPWLVRCLLSNMIVLRAECLYMKDVIEYEAECPWFFCVSEGMKIPRYEIAVNDEDGIDIQLAEDDSNGR